MSLQSIQNFILRCALLLVAAFAVSVPAFAAITVNSGPVYSPADSSDQNNRCRLAVSANLTPSTDPDKFRIALLYDGVLSAHRKDFDLTGGTTQDFSDILDVSSSNADLPAPGTSVTLAILERQDGNNNGVLASIPLTAADVRASRDGGATNYCKTLADAIAAGDSNTAPIADAGPDQTLSVAAGTTITLDGTGSTDPDSDPLTYAWTQTSGPAVALSDATAASPTFQAPAGDAVLVFSLVVNDGTEASPADSVTITNTVPVANTPPVADAGPDQTLSVAAGATITLDGTGSSDADGDSLTFAWTQTSGPAVTLSDATAATPTFEAPADDAVLVFSLIVNDGTDASASDSVTISNTVPLVNSAPTADAGTDQSLNLVAGATITLDGSGSSDPDGDSLTYAWTQTSGPTVVLDDAASATPSFAAPDTDATLVFSLVVNDGTVSSEADTVTIINAVAIPNGVPVANAGPDQTVSDAAGAVITLDGSASSDPDGDTLTYAWTQTSGASVTLTGADTPSPTFEAPASDDTLVFSLVVNDGTDSSDPDSVTIDFTADEAPVAVAVVSQAVVSPGGQVTLDGSGSNDDNNADLTYAWSQTSGPTVTLDDPTSATPSFTAPIVDEVTTLDFELVVSDGKSSSEPAVISVSVEPTGSVTIVMLTNGGEGTFNFTSDVSALNGSLTTTAGTGQLVADDVAAGTYTVTLADASSDGFALDTLVCSDADSTTNVVARQATILLDAGEDVTCTYSTVNSRNIASAQIKKMMVSRGTLLLANQPDMQRRKERLDGNSSRGSVQVAGLTLPGSGKLPVSATVNGGKMYASTSLSQITGGKSGNGKGSFDIWGEAILANIDTSGDEGDFSLFYGGVDYMVTDNVLIGVLGQYDTFDSESDESRRISIDGEGYMVGPYVTARVMNGVYLDGRVAWGKSDNSISPLRTFVDDFDTDRMIVAGSISGEKALSDKFTVVPTASIRHLSETQNAYVDSLGVSIEEQEIGLTELSFAPRLEFSKELDKGWDMTAFGSTEGIYSAGSDIEALMDDKFRVRLEGGASISHSENGLRLGLSLFADGLAADDFSSEGFRFSIGYTPTGR